MNEINMDNYKKVWSKESNSPFFNQHLSDDEIKKFIHQQSKDISSLFNKGIIFDLILKSIYVLAFICLAYLFKQDQWIMAFNIFMAIISSYFILFQVKIKKQLPSIDTKIDDLNSLLQTKIDFFNKTYIKAIYIGALSGPLVFLSGMMFYFYFKYEEIRSFDIEDCIVLSFGIIISYVLGIFAQLKQHRFQIKQLEECLKELDNNSISNVSIRKQKNRRIRLFIIALLFIIAGLLLFSSLVWR